MKIAVCAKVVPDGQLRLDPQSKRLDRSGEGTLNAFDVNAVEEALKLKEAGTEVEEVVIVSLGPERGLEAMRKALAMGADRVVLVSDEAAAGPGLRATSPRLGAGLRARRDQPRARRGARARGRGARAVRPAGRRLRRRGPVGRRRRPAAAPPD